MKSRSFARRILASFLVACALLSAPGFAADGGDDANSIAISDATNDLNVDLDEAYGADEIEEAANDETPPFRADTGCLPSYEARKRRLLRRTLLHSLFVIPAAPAGAIAGMKTGTLLAGKSAAANILASSAGASLGFFAAAAAVGVHEAIQLIGYLDTRRMIRLVQEAEAGATDGKATAKMLRRLEMRGVVMTPDTLQAKIRARNRSGELCDGRLTGKTGSKKLRKKLVGFHKLMKVLASSSSRLTREDER